MAKSLLKGNSKKLTKLKGSKSIKDRHKRRAITLTIERVLKKRSKEHVTNCPARVRDPSKITFCKSFVPSSDSKFFIHHSF